MNKKHILFLLLGLGILVIVYTSFANSESYANFSEAIASPNRTYHVAGTLDLDKPMEYNPVENANLFKFHMTDREGKSQEVWLNGPKPPDFDRSEEVVVIGKWGDTKFMAHKVLTKCPSKYNETEAQQKGK
jgi:cytochrome c-type biogenesis protein CcmE